jgi:hypothetical protein
MVMLAGNEFEITLVQKRQSSSSSTHWSRLSAVAAGQTLFIIHLVYELMTRSCVLILVRALVYIGVERWLTKYKLEINWRAAIWCAVLTLAVSWNQLMLSGIKWHSGFSLIVPIVWTLASLIRLWWCSRRRKVEKKSYSTSIIHFF